MNQSVSSIKISWYDSNKGQANTPRLFKTPHRK